MRAELPVVSFLSLALLLIILPGQIKSNTVPAVSIIAWLFFSNLIHGVNSIIWSGNTDEHALVWCDIATVVLHGAMAALPGSFLCISRRLEMITSFREAGKKHSKTYNRVFEVTMCLLLPVVYMALHTIVQDHRFSIVKDLGCQTAVYNSLPALILVWLPPLCISTISVVYCLSAVINVSKSHYNERPYFPLAPEMTLSLFIRRIIFAVSGMLYVAVVYVIILSTATSSGLSTWTSVSKARSGISTVEILSTPSQISVESELTWWFVPVWSLLLCVLSAFGEETQRGYRSMFKWLSQRFRGEVLPTHLKSSVKATAVPIDLLRSGWDDDLNPKSPVGSFRSKQLSLFKKSDSTRASSPSIPSSPEDENSFTQSTLDYLASSTAQQLRLPSPPPLHRLQVHPLLVMPFHRPSADTLSVPQAVTDADSIISASPGGSILSADAWPRPPPTIPSPISPQASPMNLEPPRSSSPVSVRSSLGSTIVDALGAIPTHLRDSPFNINGPGVVSVPPTQRPRGRTQHRSPIRTKSRKNEVIYMTVVQETVVGP